MKPLLLAIVLLVLAAQCIGAAPRTEEVEFFSRGTRLAGSLVLPAGEVRAAVVFVHGSGKQARDLRWANRFADAGIAALVYDKRGVGKSGGEYEERHSVGEKNLSLLADDALAAVRRLSMHSLVNGKKVGLAGISQAGWIAPLAAQRSDAVEFLVMWSGPVCKVSEEDIYSKYTSDADGHAPPYVEALKAREVKYIWPDFLGRDIDSGDSLATLSIPGLWIFSDNDASIPVDLSIERLRQLRRAGHGFDYALFSGLGHNNMEGTFHVAVEWIGRSHRPDR